MPSVRHGRDDNLRSIEQVFNDVTAPGLERQPDFLHERVFVEIDHAMRQVSLIVAACIAWCTPSGTIGRSMSTTSAGSTSKDRSSLP